MKKEDIGLLWVFRELKKFKLFKEITIEGNRDRCIIYIRYNEYDQDLRESRKVEDFLLDLTEGIQGLDTIHKSDIGEMCIIFDEEEM